MHSCIYAGQVRHRRFSPKRHEFRYRLFYAYLDLDELDEIFEQRWLWSTNRPNLAWFKRSDYFGKPETPIKQAVTEFVEKQTGKPPAGPIRLLTHLRYFGYVFNPVSFYYCFDAADTYIETIVAEITNTPWGERHAYILSAEDDLSDSSHMQFHLSKQFHISPFMPMAIRYDWRFTQPRDTVSVHMSNYQNSEKVFDATLYLEKQTINAANCARALVFFPLMTVKVITAIYWQALRLFLKRIPFYSHPDQAGPKTKGGANQANRV